MAPIYFYHPDHLGTSTALTDFNGNAYQFFLNLPFGETMAEQLGSNYYNTPYKFNGKELDEETGLYYYGARYYDPRISIWLSVDSEFEEFPNASPYNYCLQSPLNLVDPDGRSPIPPFTFAGYGIMLNSIKETYTNMSNGDSFFTAFAKAQSSNAHSLLDAAGLVPVCGEIFDGINASWYGLEGDYTNAGFSAAAMIPLAGWASTGTKWLVKGFKISESSAKLIKYIGKAEKGKEVIMKTFSNTFGDAKKVVDEIIDLGDDAVDYISTTGKGKNPFYNKTVGKMSADGKKGWRLDYDAKKGGHINWWNGKKKGAILTNQGENQVKQAIINETIK